MILYHGSNLEIIKPDILHSRDRVDFGQGFYLTPHYEQAKKWCQKFITLKKEGVVSRYEFDTAAYKECKVLKFDYYDEKWLDFIVSCRTGKKAAGYDIIEGGVANDKVFNTIELFLSDLIDKKEVIKRLKYEKPNWQICLKKQHVIDSYLKFSGSEKL
ncbi:MULTISPECIES: DUF3990 domain-containing protein [unclassified Treponema]|uniref:DUF3990 domain-containing protein n=1 Tax=unclassified Treponema TaxID=2638727 RepID=UPI0020A2C16F|nr:MULTISPECIES: DUF3990 domain-containing protein [unclassified Treponema]UTC67410.1 DUF3990 domain-containing protein [Treponema sp. OMZ 789]UTC70138.1 DUF3990 domain-containing protein [Treponema sp. OMZ 790]UTC72853.1 DUF3990 domain-containing protein [Treponema sp. OMZ 791]